MNIVAPPTTTGPKAGGERRGLVTVHAGRGKRMATLGTCARRLTGRNAPEDLVAIADTTTEMTLVEHHRWAGLPAQRGIED